MKHQSFNSILGYIKNGNRTVTRSQSDECFNEYNAFTLITNMVNYFVIGHGALTLCTILEATTQERLQVVFVIIVIALAHWCLVCDKTLGLHQDTDINRLRLFKLLVIVVLLTCFLILLNINYVLAYAISMYTVSKMTLPTKYYVRTTEYVL